MDANESLLQNLEHVQRLATSFAYRFGYEPEELVQEACVYWLRYWDRRPTDMPAENFLRCYINYHLIDVTKRNQRYKGTLVPEQAGSDESISVFSLLDGLSEDAQQLASIFMETPAEIRGALRGTNGHRRSASIVQTYLRGMGWSRDRVYQAWHALEAACTH